MLKLETRSPLRDDASREPREFADFTLLECLSTTGETAVYMARQREPERVVALKILEGSVDVETVQRFRFDAQALASLKHPSIPSVFSVGQYEGASYFATDLPTGPRVTEWVVERRLDVLQRVALLAVLCDVVHHAHLRGVVHRRLSPASVRMQADGTPQVDFALAESAAAGAYQSPENRAGSIADVRSDVYALGVLGFELLTGGLPTGAPSLNSLSVSPELAAIITRAIDDAPERRYASAGDFASDLGRLLALEPVEAFGSGAAYRLRCFARRHRVLVATGSSLMVVLLLGAASSTSQYLRAQHQRSLAERQAQQAQQTLAFLSTVLSTAKNEANGRQATIGAALDQAAARLSSAQLAPAVEVAVRNSLANTYIGIGEWQSAAAQARLALAAHQGHHLAPDEDLAEVFRVMTQVYEEDGDTEKAVDFAQRAVDLEEHLHAASVHTHASNSQHVAAIALRDDGRVEAAVEHHRRAIELEREVSKTSNDVGDLSAMLEQFGMTLVTIGRFDEAAAAYDEGLRLKVSKYGPEHAQTATSYHHRAFLELDRGNFEEAHAWLSRSIAIRLESLGKDHVRLALARALMTRIQLGLGHVSQAADEAAETTRVAELSYGAHSGRYARLASVQVLAWLAQGRREEALAFSEQLLELITARFGPKHYVTAEARSNRALALLAMGRRDEAVAELKEVVDTTTRVLGEHARITREARERLAHAIAAQEPQ